MAEDKNKKGKDAGDAAPAGDGDKATNAAPADGAAPAAAAPATPEVTPEAAAGSGPKKPEEKKDEAPVTAEQVSALMERVTKQDEQLAAQAAQITAMQTITAPVVEERERERQALVEALGTNEAVPFDKAELEGKPLDELRKLTAMARGENYAGRGGPQVGNKGAGTETQFAVPVPYWQTDAKPKKEE